MIRYLKSLLFRLVLVEIAHPEYDVARIKIDSADGSEIQDIFLSKNNTFSVYAVFDQMMKDSNGKVKDLEITVKITNKTKEKDIIIIKIPNWARYKLLNKLKKICKEFNWNGQIPKPSADFVYR